MAGEFYVGKDEAFELAVSILTIALVFTFVDVGLGIRPSEFILYMTAGIITLGTGFIMHELAHKYVAIKYGAKARFKAWPMGLAFALGLAVVPQIIWGPGAAFFFIAPGAVYIYATRGISVRQNGIISIAGPAMNWLLAFFFLGLFFLLSANPAIGPVLYFGFRVNMLLALFNLIPFYPLDGSKIFAWDRGIWLAAVLFSFLGMGIPGALGF